MKYAWIERNRRHWPISLACEVLGVSPSGYHERKAREIGDTSRPRRNISNDALLVHIRAVHAETKGEYGWPRVWKELLARGIRVGKERVQKLMKLHGIKARAKRKYKATTDSNHNLPVAENLLQRDFSPAAPDRVWSSDITYIATDEGWLYLAVVIDLFSRQVVGWSMKPHMRTRAGQRRAAHGVVPPASGGRLDLPQRPRQPVLQPRVPESARGLRHAQLDEPKGRLLGQRGHREPVGIAEGRSAAWTTLRDTA